MTTRARDAVKLAPLVLAGLALLVAFGMFAADTIDGAIVQRRELARIKASDDSFHVFLDSLDRATRGLIVARARERAARESLAVVTHSVDSLLVILRRHQ